MEAPKDKRTKAYKEWVKAQKEAESTGLGDVVETITKATGIKKAVEFIAGEDCGCSDRKKKWNKIRFAWQPINCFTEDQYNWWTEFKKLNPPSLTTNQVEEIRRIIIHLFARDIGRPSCCMEQWINKIDQVYEKYQ